MPDFTVHRHGDRWSVAEDGEESPLQEFPTREAAESAARHLADGGNVRVVDEDPTTLETSAEPGGADRADRPQRIADGLADDEHVRSKQGGL